MPEPSAHIAGWWTSLGALLLSAALLHFILKWLISRTLRPMIERFIGRMPDHMVRQGVLRWLPHMLPAMFIHRTSPGFLGDHQAIISALQTASLLYLILVAVLTLYAAANTIVYFYEKRPFARQMPATGFAQVIKIVIALIALVLAISVLINRSPVIILSGFGAMTAILLLVFKDAILGFVAGIQLATNRMIAVGDWIEMPKYGADGDVEEVALTTVKVRNWDKTRTTIPTYALISDSFKNWRGMTEAGGRRIKRSLLIDVQSIRLLTPELQMRLGRILLLREYFENKEREIHAWHEERGFASREESGINGRHLTNIGTFRAYVENYLRNHPQIHQTMTLLVRQLPPDDRGLPLEIYCFTNDTRWAHYESIQADIFDHLIAMSREFELRVYQKPSGFDLRRLANVAEAGV